MKSLKEKILYYSYHKLSKIITTCSSRINFKHFIYKNCHINNNNKFFNKNKFLYKFIYYSNKNKMEEDINREFKNNNNSLENKISIDTNIEAIDESKSSKKEKYKKDKISNKKLAKAINVLKFHEGVQREIFNDEPTLNLWVYHFGNGDEDDQKGIKDYFTENFGECKVYMFPGISYGFIELRNLEQASKIIPPKNNDDENHNQINTSTSDFNKNKKINYKYNGINIKFKTGERKIYVFFSSITLDKVKENNNSTFPIAHYKINIPGLYVIDDFMTEEEEKKLIEDIDSQTWHKLTNRRVQHYGYEFIYGANSVNKNNKIGELPEFCNNLKKKFEDLLKLFYKNKSLQGEIYEYKNDDNIENIEKINIDDKINDNANSFYEQFGNFDQLTINDYNPGEGIPPHVDSHSPFEDVFCAISIGSGVVMTFLSPNYEFQHVYLKPRSMIIFSGECRYLYQHSISLRKLDRVEDNIIFRKRRISLTFRKIRNGECNCPYIKFCDSQKSKLTKVSGLNDFKIEIKKGEGGMSTGNLIKNNMTHTDDSVKDLNLENVSMIPTEIEKIHVYEVYEKIAPHFSHTRYKPWPKVAEYLNSLPDGCINADIGCGNGKYINVNDKIFTIATDRSFNLVNIAKEKQEGNQVFVADSLKLPLRSNSFDSAISIAVVHHFSNVELRMKAISELIRILKPGGTFLIYVWALEQEGKKFNQQDNFVPWHLQNTYENEKQIETLGPEIIREEKKNSTVYHRYYHMFKQGELEDVIKKLANVTIVESFYDHANWCCIVRKEL